MNTAALARQIIEEARAICEPRDGQDGRDVDFEELALHVNLIIVQRELDLEEEAFVRCRPRPWSVAAETHTAHLPKGLRLQLRGTARRWNFGHGWESWEECGPLASPEGRPIP